MAASRALWTRTGFVDVATALKRPDIVPLQNTIVPRRYQFPESGVEEFFKRTPVYNYLVAFSLYTKYGNRSKSLRERLIERNFAFVRVVS